MTTYYKEDDMYIIGNQMDEVENVSYKEIMIKFHAISIAPAIKELLEKDQQLKSTHNDDDICQKALDVAEQSYNETSHKTFDSAFKDIFQKELKKKDQIRLLKDVKLTNCQLGSVFNFADECGYKFSNYRWQGEPKSVRDVKLPSFMHKKDDGSIEYIGDTTINEGQMRTIIDQAQVLIARVFDNGTHWHCFLQTFKGLKGKEVGVQGNRPHIHYLSDSFGISKEELIKKLRIGEYPNTPVHIPLLDDNSDK